MPAGVGYRGGKTRGLLDDRYAPDPRARDRAYSIDDDYDGKDDLMPGFDVTEFEPWREIEPTEGSPPPQLSRYQASIAASPKVAHAQDEASTPQELFPPQAPKVGFTALHGNPGGLIGQVKDLTMLTKNLSEQLVAQSEAIKQLKAGNMAHGQLIDQVKTENVALREVNGQQSTQLQAIHVVQKSHQTAMAAEQDHLSTLAKLVSSETKHSASGLGLLTTRVQAVEAQLAASASSTTSEAQRVASTMGNAEISPEVLTLKLRDLTMDYINVRYNIRSKQAKLTEHSDTLKAVADKIEHLLGDVENNEESQHRRDETIDAISEGLNALKSFHGSTPVNVYESNVTKIEPDCGSDSEVLDPGIDANAVSKLSIRHETFDAWLTMVASKVDQVDSKTGQDRALLYGVTDMLKRDMAELKKAVKDFEAFKASQILVNKDFHARQPGVGNINSQALTSKVNKISQDLKETNASVDKVAKDLLETSSTVKRVDFSAGHPYPGDEALKLQQMIDSIGLKSQRINKLVTATQNLDQAQDSIKERLDAVSESITGEQSATTARINQLTSDLERMKAKVDSLMAAQTKFSVEKDEKAEADSQSALNSSSDSAYMPPYARMEARRSTYVPPGRRRNQGAEGAFGKLLEARDTSSPFLSRYSINKKAGQEDDDW